MPFYTSRIIVQLIPHALLKPTLGWQDFSLMKFSKCQNLNSVSWDKCSTIDQIFKKFANVKQNWKIKKQKLFWKIVEKLVSLLAGQVAKLARPSHVGTLALGHVDHAGTHGACDLANSNWKRRECSQIHMSWFFFFS